METKEENSNENKCCGTVNDKWKMSEMMENCCQGMSGTNDCSSMMAECIKGCRWFPLMPVIFGTVLVLLGYYLDSEIIRILWMIGAGFLILMGTFCLLMMNNIIRRRHITK